ncbi:MAG: hypothetical protein HFF11_05935 [Angelakisella sp.]|jgi:hypothetical protein|nr:hypothetical protein [Angelakisella sp.]
MKQTLCRAALGMALTMVFFLGGCSGQKSEPIPVQGKSLVEQGAEIAAQVVEIAGNQDYLSLYTGDKETLEILTQAVEGKDYTTPKTVYSLTLSQGAAEKVLGVLGVEEMENLPDSLKARLQERTFQALTTQINAMSGANTLAATSICMASKVFVNDQLTEGVIYLYTYENGMPIAVTFLPGEDGAVSGSGTFLLNEDFQVESLEDLSGPLGILGVKIGVVDQ